MEVVVGDVAWSGGVLLLTLRRTARGGETRRRGKVQSFSDEAAAVPTSTSTQHSILTQPPWPPT